MAYFENGDLDKALELYQHIISLNVLRYCWGDIYVRSYYMLGKIYEAQGDTAKAIDNYEKFLDLWKEADLGIYEVEDARKRLAKLGEQGD